MTVRWTNIEGNKRSCNINIIEDIVFEDVDAAEDVKEINLSNRYILAIKPEIVLTGGILAKFKHSENREKAYEDIKAAFEDGAEDFVFHKRHYERG